MYDVSKLNFKVGIQGEMKTVIERPISPEKMIQWVQNKHYSDYVKEELIKKIRRYPPGALRHLDLEKTIAEIETRRMKDAEKEVREEKSEGTADSSEESCAGGASTTVAPCRDEDSGG